MKLNFHNNNVWIISVMLKYTIKQSQLHNANFPMFCNFAVYNISRAYTAWTLHRQTGRRWADLTLPRQQPSGISCTFELMPRSHYRHLQPMHDWSGMCPESFRDLRNVFYTQFLTQQYSHNQGLPKPNMQFIPVPNDISNPNHILPHAVRTSAHSDYWTRQNEHNVQTIAIPRFPKSLLMFFKALPADRVDHTACGPFSEGLGIF